MGGSPLLGSAFLALPGLAYWLQRPACTLRPEPPWLAQSLARLPERALSERELAVLERDGVVPVKTVISDEKILQTLVYELYRVYSDDGHFLNLWTWAGAFRALIRDGPIGGLAASSLRVGSVRLVEMGPFAYNQKTSPLSLDEHLRAAMSTTEQGWHFDVDGKVDYEVPMRTVWLSATRTPHSLLFLGGSHAVSHPCDPDDSVDISCIQGLHDNISAMRGGASPLLTWDLAAGDTLVFNGQVYHYTLPTAERAALAMRFVPGDYAWKGPITEMQIGAWRQWFPVECEPLSGPLFPQVYPRSNSTVDTEKWPLPPSNWGKQLGHVRAWFTERWDFFVDCP